VEYEAKKALHVRATTSSIPIDHRVASLIVFLVTIAASLGCGMDSVSGRVVQYRAEIETVLETPISDSASRSPLPLPARRDRRLEVGDQRIGPFDFLSILGCRLSEVVAARNSALGKVLVPTRRLAHEIAVLEAIDDCLPALGEERARRLGEHAAQKRAELPAHVWNAVWLDRDLERFLSTAPASFVGGGDPSDGARQLARAAEALDRLDVEALESALHALRDNPAMGSELSDLMIVTEELQHVSRLMSHHSGNTSGEACDVKTRRLSRVFEAHYASFQPALGELDRAGRELLASLRSLFRVTARGNVRIPDAMQRYHLELLEDAEGADLAARFRAAIVEHATAWGPVLETCGVIPGRPA